MKFYMPKHNDVLQLREDWAMPIIDGDRMNNTFLMTYAGCAQEELRASKWSSTEDEVSTEHTVHLKAGTRLLVQLVESKKPWGEMTEADCAIVTLRIPKQKGVKASKPFRVTFDEFFRVDFDILDEDANQGQRIISTLTAGQGMELSARRLVPGKDVRGSVFLYPRGSLTTEELLQKRLLVIRHGSGIRIGVPHMAGEGYHYGVGSIRYFRYGSEKSYGSRCKPDLIIGWATDSPLEALANALTEE